MRRIFTGLLSSSLLVWMLGISSCAQAPVVLNYSPNFGETQPSQFRSSLRFGFVTFDDQRVAKRLMGDATLIGWGSNTFRTNQNVPDHVTKAFVDTYQYLGLKAIWIKSPPDNFSFSTKTWVSSLKTRYPNVDVFVIGKIRDYEFLLRSGGLSGAVKGKFSALAATTQARVELYYLDSESGRIIWGNTLHHNTYDQKVSKKAPTDFASMRLDEALHNVVLQSVDRVLPKINSRNPGSIQVLSGMMADVPKTPEGKTAGTVPPDKGRIEVVSHPSGAMVYLDGIYYGVTPLALDVQPGVHLLKVKKDGFETGRDKIGVLAGKVTPWSGVLPPKN